MSARRALLTCGLVLVLGSENRAQAQLEPPLVPEADLSLRSYAATNADAVELVSRGRALFGRVFQVKETGLLVQAEDSLFALGDTVFVYETAERSERILAAIAQMDVSGAPPYAVRVYAPRHAPIQFLMDGLAPLLRDIPISAIREDGTAPNVTVSEGVGHLILRDAPPRIDEMLAVLQALDVVGPKAYLICFIVQSVPEPGLDVKRETDRTLELAPTPPPPELVMALQLQLRRKMEFDMLGMASAAIALRSAQSVSLKMDLSVSGRCEIAFKTGAYDADSKTLVFESFEFQHRLYDESRFSTSASLAADEFDVIGSVGKPPIFVVLRLVLDPG